MNKKSRAGHILLQILAGVIVLLVLFPILWLFRTALVPPVALYQRPPELFFTPTFSSFPKAFKMGALESRMVNSVVISISSTLVAVFLGVMAGYGSTRFRFPLGKYFQVYVLFLRMVPAVALLLPLFMMFNGLHLIDTRFGMVMVYASGALSTVIWLSWSYFRTLSREIEESAYIDGCGYFRTFLQIILPISTPIVASVAILTFTGAWNEFMMATILTRQNAVTLPPGISAMMSQTDLAWDQISAASMVVSIPLVALCIFAQKYFIRGLTVGSVKG